MRYALVVLAALTLCCSAAVAGPDVELGDIKQTGNETWTLMINGNANSKKKVTILLTKGTPLATKVANTVAAINATGMYTATANGNVISLGVVGDPPAKVNWNCDNTKTEENKLWIPPPIPPLPPVPPAKVAFQMSGLWNGILTGFDSDGGSSVFSLKTNLGNWNVNCQAGATPWSAFQDLFGQAQSSLQGTWDSTNYSYQFDANKVTDVAFYTSDTSDYNVSFGYYLVPEPSSLLALGTGALCALMGVARRRVK